MERELKIGDIVHLKSGSPDLTVVAISGDNVTTEWISNGNKVTGDFPAACLC